MPSILRMTAALLFVSCFTFAQDKPAAQEQPAAQDKPAASKSSTPSPIPVEAMHQVNPVKATPESLAAGKKWYGYDCEMCHGKPGDGKGSVGTDMKLTMSDFSDPASLKDKTDGELLYIIKNGKGQMPPEGDRLKGNELWNLVNYVRSLANKKKAAEEKTGQ